MAWRMVPVLLLEIERQRVARQPPRPLVEDDVAHGDDGLGLEIDLQLVGLDVDVLVLELDLAREHRVILALVLEVRGAAGGRAAAALGGELELEVEAVRTRSGRAGRTGRRRRASPAAGGGGSWRRLRTAVAFPASARTEPTGARGHQRSAGPGGAGSGAAGSGLLRRGGQAHVEGQQQGGREV